MAEVSLETKKNEQVEVIDSLKLRVCVYSQVA